MKPRFEAEQTLAGWLVWDELSQLYILDYGDDEAFCKAKAAELNDREKTVKRSITVLNGLPKSSVALPRRKK